MKKTKKKTEKKNVEKKNEFFGGEFVGTYDPSLDNRDWGPAVRRHLEEANRLLKNTKLPW